MVRSFLDFASQHTVEELQAFTSQWVPHPQWIKVEDVAIPEEHIKRSAKLIEENLGVDGVREVGGTEWWQWRKPKSILEGQWIEMRSHANARKLLNEPCRRVMLYIHGGAYFFGSVDEHRYQMQRHARKLQARVFAPKYRLAPQFPFPCGLHDCLAAYLYLLTIHDPSHIVVAGDSAGGGMVVALLCILRDHGVPLPAGGILISPWVDLTHSFPSVAGSAPFDYIPQAGFHHKPSRSWPPPNEDDITTLRDEAERKKTGKRTARSNELERKQQPPVAEVSESKADTYSTPNTVSGGITTNPDKFLTVEIDGETVVIKEQIQMYTTNTLLRHPLVSPVMQPTLGGLPPLLIMVGGGEILRDEQIYLAHKCAHPAEYAPETENLTELGRGLLKRYPPTDVQLQVWDDLCHVAPTLSFTRPAKYMYRSIAQFGAWALARAQHRGIEILDDDQISVISTDSQSGDEDIERALTNDKNQPQGGFVSGSVGKAGDALPPFQQHMIRQRVDRHGVTYPLEPESELPGCSIAPNDVGQIKEGPVRKWLATKKQFDTRFSSTKAKVHKKIVANMVKGYQEFGPGERPPPSALAGRRLVDSDWSQGKKSKSMGLALWSLWGSKHDEMTVDREQKAGQRAKKGDDTGLPETKPITLGEGEGARPFDEIEQQATTPVPDVASRSRSRRRTVVDENQTDGMMVDENTPVAQLLALRKTKETGGQGFLTPDYQPETGVAGKRPFVGGIAMPFSLDKEAETASMMTLQSEMSPPSGPRPVSPIGPLKAPSTELLERNVDEGVTSSKDRETQRPDLETFVTAPSLPLAINETGARDD